MENALETLCTIHNTISPESIHLALVDLEDDLVANPDMTLTEFLTKFLDHGQVRDHDRYAL